MGTRHRLGIGLSVFALALVVMGAAKAYDIWFEDVPRDHIFADDIDWMMRNGVTQGCRQEIITDPDGSKRRAYWYCPQESVTRGQMAAFLHRLYNTARTNVMYEGETLRGVFTYNGTGADGMFDISFSREVREEPTVHILWSGSTEECPGTYWDPQASRGGHLCVYPNYSENIYDVRVEAARTYGVVLLATHLTDHPAWLEGTWALSASYPEAG